MENNLRHSLDMILSGVMKEKEEFVNKICQMIEQKECGCQPSVDLGRCDCHSTVDLGSGKNINKNQCCCTMQGECACGDDCQCRNCKCNDKSHHPKMAKAILEQLEKIVTSLDEINTTLKHGKNIVNK